MTKLRVEQSEWLHIEQLARDKLINLPVGYFGIIKMDKRETNLEHSFMLLVENGKLINTFAMARKKAVGVEGILGEGSFSVVALAETKNGHQYAMKIQGGSGKVTIGDFEKKDINQEMDFLKVVNELEGHGFKKDNNKTKHYSFMKLKQGNELYKKIYIPITEEQADQLVAEGRGGELTYEGDIDLEPDNIQFIHHTLFSRREQLLIAIKCIQGIQLLHDKNIIHRDIKPENTMARFGTGVNKDIIIITPTDLGLSLRLPLGVTEELKCNPSGTPKYKAPEVDKGILCKANDVYSLGVMFKFDFRMEDDFIINEMLVEEHTHRTNLRHCQEYFEENLRNELSNDTENDKITEKMELLLADEERLLIELEKMSEPKSVLSNKIHDVVNKINDMAGRAIAPQDAQQVLQLGYQLMLEASSQKIGTTKYSSYRERVKEYNKKLDSYFPKESANHTKAKSKSSK